MCELDTLRQEIDRIDKEMVALFERRMAVTQQVGEYKQKVGMAVLDKTRHRAVLESKAELVTKPELKTDVTLLYETIMGFSRRQQRKIVREGAEAESFTRIRAAMEHRREPVENPRVVYQGEPGAYSEQASRNFFGDDVNVVGLKQFEDVFLAIRDGKADYGVVPIENNSTGAIRQVYDLLAKYEFSLVGETTVKVEHCLAAPKGADESTITHVYSHEQGIFQSEEFLKQYPAWGACFGHGYGGQCKICLRDRRCDQGRHLLRVGGGAVWAEHSGPEDQLQRHQHHPVRGGVPQHGTAARGGQDQRRADHPPRVRQSP